MRKKVLIFGTSMFSAEMAEIFACEGEDVVGFVVDAEYKRNEIFQNLPVFTFEGIERSVDIKTTEFALTLGYSEMNNHREAKFNNCKSNGFRLFTFISSQAQVFTKQIGEGSLILPGTYIGPYSKIGVGTVVRPGTVLAHHDLIGDFNWIADGCTFGGGVKMGNKCFVGLGSTVRNEVTLADYTLVGAHTYIGKNTEINTTYYGVPGRGTEKDSLETIKCV